MEHYYVKFHVVSYFFNTRSLQDIGDNSFPQILFFIIRELLWLLGKDTAFIMINCYNNMYQGASYNVWKSTRYCEFSCNEWWSKRNIPYGKVNQQLWNRIIWIDQSTVYWLYNIIIMCRNNNANQSFPLPKLIKLKLTRNNEQR